MDGYGRRDESTAGKRSAQPLFCSVSRRQRHNLVVERVSCPRPWRLSNCLENCAERASRGIEACVRDTMHFYLEKTSRRTETTCEGVVVRIQRRRRNACEAAALGGACLGYGALLDFLPSPIPPSLQFNTRQTPWLTLVRTWI